VTRAPRRRWLLPLAAALVIAALVGGRWLALDVAERLWAGTVRGGEAYLAARDLARLAQGCVLLFGVVWGTANLFTVYRAIGSVQMPRHLGNIEIVEAVPQGVLLAGTLASGLIYGLVLAWNTGDWGLRAALAAAPPRFGVVDPVLQRDAGYYVAELPWTLTLQGASLLAAVTAAVLVGLLYAGIGSLRVERGRLRASPHARRHLGVLLACVALALAWGALLDPAEVVAGLHGTMDRGALAVRIPGATVVAAVALGTVILSLGWAWREREHLLGIGWAALLLASGTVYVAAPALVRGARGAPPPGDAVASLARERRDLERVAFGLEHLTDASPPPFATLEASVAALHVWDADRVAAVARGALGPRAAVAGAAPSPRAAGGPGWTIGTAPDRAGLARAEPRPTWTDVHRGAWARAHGRVAALEADTGLAVVPLPQAATWFAPGMADFAVAAPDTWPGVRAADIPLTGAWRRAALAWALQSPALLRAETDGLVLLWRRDVRERLARIAPFATFESPVPIGAPGSLWWIAYGYVGSRLFPLAAPLTVEGRSLRYLRVSVLGAVHASTGETHVYLVPGYDSLSAAWGRLFAPLVQPPESLPPELRRQLPYPRGALRVAVEALGRARRDTVEWTPWPHDPVDVIGPAGDAWAVQGFETGSPPRLAALVAGTLGPAGPRLARWEPPEPEALPTLLVGSARTRPGVLRVWPAGGGVVTLQGLFADAPRDSAAVPVLLEVHLSWGGRTGRGPTAEAALRSLRTAGAVAAPGDTSLHARWSAVRRLAAQADSALAAGDLERFGGLWAQLRRLLDVQRRLAPPTARP